MLVKRAYFIIYVQIRIAFTNIFLLTLSFFELNQARKESKFRQQILIFYGS